MAKGFDILIGSHTDYEDLIAEIEYDHEPVALISQEDGFINLKITLYSPVGAEKWEFRFEEFDFYIQHAKKRLWELRRTEEVETIELVDV